MKIYNALSNNAEVIFPAFTARNANHHTRLPATILMKKFIISLRAKIYWSNTLFLPARTAIYVMIATQRITAIHAICGASY